MPAFSRTTTIIRAIKEKALAMVATNLKVVTLKLPSFVAGILGQHGVESHVVPYQVNERHIVMQAIDSLESESTKPLDPSVLGFFKGPSGSGAPKSAPSPSPLPPPLRQEEACSRNGQQWVPKVFKFRRSLRQRQVDKGNSGRSQYLEYSIVATRHGHVLRTVKTIINASLDASFVLSWQELEEWNSKNVKAQTRMWLPAQAREMWMADPAARGPIARTRYDPFAISTTKDWFRDQQPPPW
ncbi:hypothetical protein BC827DRAFT_1156647 [Russula dissimulans]|nr:hypothetical protein BC827DRAFT_1156647 [Russula dissimulans]